MYYTKIDIFNVRLIELVQGYFLKHILLKEALCLAHNSLQNMFNTFGGDRFSVHFKVRLINLNLHQDVMICSLCFENQEITHRPPLNEIQLELGMIYFTVGTSSVRLMDH